MSNERVTPEDRDAFLKQCTEIVPEAIHEEFTHFPAEYAFWNAAYADAYRVYVNAKVDLDILERELYAVMRAQLEQAGKVTEKMIEASLAQSEVWKEQKRAVAAADADQLKAKGVVESLRAKKDMLVGIGAHLRVEMQGDPVLRSESAEFGRKMGFGGA